MSAWWPSLKQTWGRRIADQKDSGLQKGGVSTSMFVCEGYDEQPLQSSNVVQGMTSRTPESFGNNRGLYVYIYIYIC